MALHNIPVAEAILRLFDIRLSWEEVEKIEAQDEALRRIKDFIIQQDKLRAGELPLKRTTVAMLNSAFDAGCRLKMAEREGKRVVAVVSANERVVHVETTDELGLLYPELVWQSLCSLATGKKCPDYDLQDIGEMILSDLSKRQLSMRRNLGARHGIDLTEYRGEISTFFDFRKAWGLSSISELKIKFLESALNKCFRSAGSPVCVRLNMHSSVSQSGDAPQLGCLLYERFVKRVGLGVMLESEDAAITTSIDINQVFNDFKRRMEAQTAQLLDLSHRAGCKTTKSIFFTRVRFDPYIEIKGELTQRQMEDEVSDFRGRMSRLNNL